MGFPLPFPVTRALRKLGRDMQHARRRRRISTKMMAERAGISRTTLAKIERGGSGVSLGNYASVLFVLGNIHYLSELLDVSNDALGLDLMEDELPKRIRHKRRE